MLLASSPKLLHEVFDFLADIKSIDGSLFSFESLEAVVGRQVLQGIEKHPRRVEDTSKKEDIFDHENSEGSHTNELLVVHATPVLVVVVKVAEKLGGFLAL